MGNGLEATIVVAPVVRRLRIGIAWRPVFALLVFGGLLYGRDLYGQVGADARVTPEVQEAMAAQQYVDVSVLLDFQPEDFHIKYFQSLGTMSGVDGTRIKLRRVRIDRMRDLAKNYWILRIELMPVS